ncbi:MAG: MarR family winged helix-turn-helix transcriptional regulator [Desulfobulbus sp.]
MALENIGLYHAQGMILFRLWREDGLSQARLAEALHIAPPTVSNTLKRMERDEWIQRQRDENDQRIVRVYLTEKAKQLRAEAHASFTAMDQEFATILSEEEREILRRSLLKVYHYLAEKHPSAACGACKNQELHRKEELK